MTECIACGQSSVVSKNQALKLNCTGIHFLEENGRLIPIQSKALRTGNHTVLHEVEYGIDVQIGNNCDLYHCRIGNHTKIKHFVEIQGNVIIGQFCKIQSFVFIPEGTRIGNYVFIGPGVVFTNDKNPRATGEWKMAPVTVEDNVTIGANSTLLPGITLGEGSLVGAGSVVIRSVPPHIKVVGNPAMKLYE
jgi:acetyltransferase-like isoleucine patch superfamily enzyme